MEFGGDEGHERLLGSENAATIFMRKVTTVKRCYLLLLSLIDALCCVFLVYILSSSRDLSCDTALPSWLTLFSVLSGLSVCTLVFRYYDDTPFTCSCTTCCVTLFRAFEALWILIGVYRTIKAEQCSEDVLFASNAALLAYCVKSCVFCGFCCVFLGVSVDTARRNRVLPMSEVTPHTDPHPAAPRNDR